MVLAESGLTVKTIINTHGHFDHVSANQRMKEVTGAELLIHTLDAPMLSQLSATAAAWGMSSDDSPPPDRTIADGDVVQVGNITLTVIHTPGHTPGGISLHSDGAVFVGDTLFAGSIGRTDFPGGDFDDQTGDCSLGIRTGSEPSSYSSLTTKSIEATNRSMNIKSAEYAPSRQLPFTFEPQPAVTLTISSPFFTDCSRTT